jgi:MFS family permease
MKVYRNIKEIRRKDSIGRRFTLTGMGVLALGFLASLVPTWFPPDAPIQPGINGFLQQYWSWISFGALFVGFLCASIGSYYINRYARRRWPGSRFVERPEQVLERNLKGLDDKFAYFVQSLPAGYLLAGPNGITIFALRSDKGKVVVEGNRWKEPFSLTRFFTFFAREGVGAPDQEIEEQKNKLRALLAGGAGLADVPMDGAAVFLNPQINLTLNNPVIPVLLPEQVKDHVRARVKEARVPNATQRTLVEYLAANAVWQEE